ncbi:type IV pilus major pilin [Salmonella enterica]|nr:type IV pilus major pilin [Salmonella enterica]EKY8363890.1 type IV pilus major pilin [Salmonella enterica]ELG3533572.1 type IV pilus major pilin [Salmonella enterica]
MKTLYNIRKRCIAQQEKYLDIKKQRGMTLLEIIIVLGIIGTIAAGVVILAQRAFDAKAMTDLTNKINTVRTAMKDAYGSTGIYPLPAGAATVALNDETINDPAVGGATPIGKLVGLGKVSRDEAKNNISNDFISVGGGNISANGVQKGYFIEINGLNQQQCRNILLQAGNSFDYVQTTNAAAAGTYSVNNASVNLYTALSGVTAAVPGTNNAPGTPAVLTGSGIFRSLATDGNTLITADGVIGACTDDANNSVILGSR